MSKTHVSKGDEVKVIAGNHKGKQGTVLAVNAVKGQVVVEGARIAVIRAVVEEVARRQPPRLTDEIDEAFERVAGAMASAGASG